MRLNYCVIKFLLAEDELNYKEQSCRRIIFFEDTNYFSEEHNESRLEKCCIRINKKIGR